jgi:hypothetical protein
MISFKQSTCLPISLHCPSLLLHTTQIREASLRMTSFNSVDLQTRSPSPRAFNMPCPYDKFQPRSRHPLHVFSLQCHRSVQISSCVHSGRSDRKSFRTLGDIAFRNRGCALQACGLHERRRAIALEYNSGRCYDECDLRYSICFTRCRARML